MVEAPTIKQPIRSVNKVGIARTITIPSEIKVKDYVEIIELDTKKRIFIVKY